MLYPKGLTESEGANGPQCHRDESHSFARPAFLSISRNCPTPKQNISLESAQALLHLLTVTVQIVQCFA